MYPQANIPCVQLSLLESLDPASHIAMGEALRGLSENNVLIIGSGFSFHNLRAFFTAESAETRDLNQSFEDWLQHSCSSLEMSEAARTRTLINWPDAPGASYCHPRQEHLLPLHVCYGVGGGPCTEAFRLTIMNRQSSMYLW
jgi:aromatic ring-opening dioxygenase catalytic subunit (LigB family)